jgi:hypothetical protein
MSWHWDPSPPRHPRDPRSVAAVRAELLRRISLARVDRLPRTWGVALLGEIVARAPGVEYGRLLVVAPRSTTHLTQAMIERVAGEQLYLAGCLPCLLALPAVADARWYGADEALPAVELRFRVEGTWPRLGSGEVWCVVEYDHAAIRPPFLLSDHPLPGWPR